MVLCVSVGQQWCLFHHCKIQFSLISYRLSGCQTTQRQMCISENRKTDSEDTAAHQNTNTTAATTYASSELLNAGVDGSIFHGCVTAGAASEMQQRCSSILCQTCWVTVCAEHRAHLGNHHLHSSYLRMLMVHILCKCDLPLFNKLFATMLIFP